MPTGSTLHPPSHLRPPPVRIPPPARESRLGDVYAGYAAAFLIATLFSGVWLRAAFVEGAVLGGFSFGHALHAHSHLAFFGWTTMALFAILSRRGDLGVSAPWLRWHAHAAGVASAAAFVGFLIGGYNSWTIGLSVVHVAIWVAFVAEAWAPAARLGRVERTYCRGSLGFLVLAGAGAMAPGFVMARGIGDPWVSQIAVHSFLTPFMAGWLMLGAMGAAYVGLEARRFSLPAFWFTVAGVVPSALLHPLASPPAEWMLIAGRLGTASLGIGAGLFATDLLRAGRTLHPLLKVAAVAAALKGAAEVAVAAGIGLELTAVRALSIGYLHLVLLGVVTPVLMAVGLRLPRAPRRTRLYAGGLALMLASLAAMGVPAAATALVEAGFSVAWLFWSALAGGTMCALAALLLLPRRAALRDSPYR
jgi:hypothetical protein